MTLAMHCDTEGCDSWQREGPFVYMSWLLVTYGQRTFHFCSKDHLMLWAANSQPTVVIT